MSRQTRPGRRGIRRLPRERPAWNRVRRSQARDALRILEVLYRRARA